MNAVTTPLAELRFPARAEHLQKLRAAVRTAAQQCGCDPSLTDQLILAVNEAAMNIIQHAYRDAPTGEIILEIHNNGTELVFRLLDSPHRWIPPRCDRATSTRSGPAVWDCT